MKTRDAKTLSEIDTMRESEWLSSVDILATGKEKLSLVISGMQIHEGAEMGDGRKIDGGSISFTGVKRKLLLNSTNRKTLRRLFGDSADDIVGKKIIVYVDHAVRGVGGITVDGLRLRAINEK